MAPSGARSRPHPRRPRPARRLAQRLRGVSVAACGASFSSSVWRHCWLAFSSSATRASRPRGCDSSRAMLSSAARTSASSSCARATAASAAVWSLRRISTCSAIRSSSCFTRASPAAMPASRPPRSGCACQGAGPLLRLAAHPGELLRALRAAPALGGELRLERRAAVARLGEGGFELTGTRARRRARGAGHFEVRGEPRLHGPQPRELDVASLEGGGERRHLGVEIGEAHRALAQVRLELSGAHAAARQLARQTGLAALVRVDLVLQIRQQSLEQRAAPLGGLE